MFTNCQITKSLTPKITKSPGTKRHLTKNLTTEIEMSLEDHQQKIRSAFCNQTIFPVTSQEILLSLQIQKTSMKTKFCLQNN